MGILLLGRRMGMFREVVRWDVNWLQGHRRRPWYWTTDAEILQHLEREEGFKMYWLVRSVASASRYADIEFDLRFAYITTLGRDQRYTTNQLGRIEST